MDLFCFLGRNKATAGVVAAIFSSSAAMAADSQPPACDMKNPKSVCALSLTVEQIARLNAVLDAAPVPHNTWADIWNSVGQQLEAQQKRGAAK